MSGEASTLYNGPLKVISGGQTGSDLGGLVAAEKAGVRTGGECPKGCRTEKGAQPVLIERFGLQESHSSAYPPRTEKNVENADATLILAFNPDSSGTKMTADLCVKHDKPCLTLDPRDNQAMDAFLEWANEHQPEILNVAGNRESVAQGMASATVEFLFEGLQLLKHQKPDINTSSTPRL